MKIRAVSFDIGGTLIEPWPSVGHVYAEVAERCGVPGIAPDELTAGFMHAWKARADFDYSHASWFDLVRQAFGEQAAKLPAEYFPAVYERFAEADTWRIFQDVLPTLEMLTRRGLKMGVISNWDERLRPLLSRLELASYFSSFVISCEVGATKPDARLFRRAASELGVAAGELLHVGDSQAMDVQGAERIGAAAYEVVRGGPPRQPWQIGSLLELESRIAADPS